MRGTLTYASQSRAAGRATLNAETAHSMYGDEVDYSFSLYIDAGDWTTLPGGNEKVTFVDADGNSTDYVVIARQTMPGDLRRLDLGSLTGG